MIAKWLQLILVVALALSSNILAANSTFAQAVDPPSALGQDSVRVLEAHWQSLPAGAQHWYRFDYAGDNLPVRISVDTNAAGSVSFQVWTATQFLAANPDVTPAATSAPQADDPTHIVWEGTLELPGIYFIVVQPTSTETQYLLSIGGRGLTPATDGGAIVAGALNSNIRSGPSTAFPVITTVPQGMQLTVLGQDESSGWLSVRLPDGREGWIARFLTDFTGAASIIAVPSPAQQPALAPPATTTLDTAAIVAGASNVNVRGGPSTAYAVLRTVPQGTPFTVVGQDSTGTWLFVRFADNAEGWVARFLTNFVGIAPVVAAPALVPPLAPPATVPSAADAIAVTPNINVRSGPSMNFGVLRTVAPGTQVGVIGQDASGAWVAVQLADGMQGWVSRSLIDVQGTMPLILAPSVQPPLAPPATVSAVPGIESLPSQAASLDNFPIAQTLDTTRRTLSGGQIQWFSFSHPGDEEPVQIWLDSEPSGAVEFRIYRAEDAQAIMSGANLEDFVDIARGTHNPNEPADLFWRGAFDEHGRYFVMVRSGSNADVVYSIYGVGPSIGP